MWYIGLPLRPVTLLVITGVIIASFAHDHNSNVVGEYTLCTDKMPCYRKEDCATDIP